MVFSDSMMYESDNIKEGYCRCRYREFPSVVEQALDRLGHLFPNEPERRHFAEY